MIGQRSLEKTERNRREGIESDRAPVGTKVLHGRHMEAARKTDARMIKKQSK